MLKLSVVLLLTAYSFACAVRGENMRQADPPPKPEHARLYPITINEKHGFIDETGTVKFMLPENVYTTFPFSEGLAVAGRRVPNTNGRWGFIDETGKYAIEAKFVMVKPFSEGLAAVVFKENENAYRTVGFIDQSGRIVIPPQFSGEGGVSERGFSEGLAAIKVYKDQADKWGYIDNPARSLLSRSSRLLVRFRRVERWSELPSLPGRLITNGASLTPKDGGSRNRNTTVPANFPKDLHQCC